MRRTKISMIYEKPMIDKKINIKGWIRTKRDAKAFSFIEINDGSIIKNLQVIVDNNLSNYEEIKKLTTGASISVDGLLVESKGAKQPFELQAEKVEIYGHANPEDYPIQKKGISFEVLRGLAHLRSRTNTFGAVFRVRSALSYAIHKFFQDRDFFYIHSPVITSSDSEGAGEMFKVSTLDLLNVPKLDDGKIDYSKDFFGKPSFLSVSGQLEAEIMATALSQVYTFAPTFRAENSNTARHLSEFWMIEPEMAFYDLQDNIDLSEDFLKYIIDYVLTNCPSDMEFFNKWISKGIVSSLKSIVGSSFKRITYTEAIEILENSKQKFEFPVKWGNDLQSEHERYLTEKHFKCPVAVYDYPKDIKAFYMRLNDDGKTVAAVDILCPGVGEIIGGSQREERYDVLIQRIKELGLDEKDYWWFLDLRKYGTVPHSGFGLGFERMMMYITGMENIRDVIPFPRTPNSIDF